MNRPTSRRGAISGGAWTAILVASLTMTCGRVGFEASGSTRDDDSAGLASLEAGCLQMEQLCPSGYNWDAFGVATAANCEAAFTCIYWLYGGKCRGYVTALLDCLADLSDASGCTACEDFTDSMGTDCPYPGECL